MVLVDFAVILSLIVVFIFGIDYIVEGPEGLLIWVVGTIVVVISYFSIYLLISINDNLCEINKKLQNFENFSKKVEQNKEI